jgi:hypothetical protein
MFIFICHFVKIKIYWICVGYLIMLCTTSAFGDELQQMLRIIQCFGKHHSCHLQGEYVKVGCFWKPYIGQAVGGKLDMMVLIGRAE